MGIPFNEEWQYAIAIVFQRQRRPIQRRSVRPRSRARFWTHAVDAVAAQNRCEVLQIVSMQGPTHQCGILQIRHVTRIGRCRLQWIGCDDFQVSQSPEGQQCVFRAGSRVHAARRSSNAGSLVNKFNARIQVVATQDDVIKRLRHLARAGPCPSRRCQNAGGCKTKRAPRYSSHGHMLARRWT